MRNFKRKVSQTCHDLGALDGSFVLSDTSRQSAGWARTIIEELRQQLDVPWDASMDDLYRALVKAREAAATERSPA